MSPCRILGFWGHSLPSRSCSRSQNSVHLHTRPIFPSLGYESSIHHHFRLGHAMNNAMQIRHKEREQRIHIPYRSLDELIVIRSGPDTYSLSQQPLLQILHYLSSYTFKKNQNNLNRHNVI